MSLVYLSNKLLFKKKNVIRDFHNGHPLSSKLTPLILAKYELTLPMNWAINTVIFSNILDIVRINLPNDANTSMFWGFMHTNYVITKNNQKLWRTQILS